MSFTNVYHKRLVAATAAKPCFICYKTTETVLNQADSKDWFYVCPGHLGDKGFASPVVDEEAEKAAAEKKRKEELDREIEFVKKEWEEKMRKKKGKKKDDKKDDEKKDEKEEKEKDEKLKELEGKKVGNTAAETAAEDGPRVFALHKSVYQMRLQRIRNKQQAIQTQQRLRNPSAFPSVPSGPP